MLKFSEIFEFSKEKFRKIPILKEFEWFEWFEWFGPSPIEPFNSAEHVGDVGGDLALLLQGLPGAEAKPSTAMPVTKEDIDRREEKKAKGQPMTDDVESSLPDWEEDPVMKTKLKCNGEKPAAYRRP